LKAYNSSRAIESAVIKKINGECGVSRFLDTLSQYEPLTDDDCIKFGYKAGFAIDCIENEDTGEDEEGFIDEDGNVDNEAFFKLCRLVESAVINKIKGSDQCSQTSLQSK
jgi:hypothetical protein